MRLQLKDECHIVFFLVKLNIICTLMRGENDAGEGGNCWGQVLE